MSLKEPTRLTLLPVIFFAPLLAMFLLPVLAYRMPLLLLSPAAEFDAKDLVMPMAISGGWLLLALLVALWKATPKQITFQRNEWSPDTLWFWFVFLSVGGGGVAIVHQLFIFPAWLENVIHLLALLPVFGLVLGFLVIFGRGRDGWYTRRKATAYGVLAFNVLILIMLPLALGKVGPMVGVVLTIIFISHALRLRVPVQFMVIILLATTIFVGLATKTWIRVAFYGGLFERPPIESIWTGTPKKAEQAAAKFGYSLRQDRAQYVKFDLNSTQLRGVAGQELGWLSYGVARAVARLNHLSQLAWVVQETPQRIPYWEGETYRPILYAVIPRFIWKDKPVEDVGQKFGHRYGMLAPEDTKTSINLDVITEAWANGGWPVVILSALAIGLFFRLIWTWLNRINTEPIRLFGAVPLLLAAPILECNTSLALVGLLHTLLLGAGLIWIITQWDKKFR